MWGQCAGTRKFGVQSVTYLLKTEPIPKNRPGWGKMAGTMKQQFYLALFSTILAVDGAVAQQAPVQAPLAAPITDRQALAPQQIAWVQIEAQPTLAAAQERARIYAATLPDVNGFALGSGWYGISLGPYTPEDAVLVLRSYRAQGLIPSDSYVMPTADFGQQFWPVGADILGRTRAPAPAETATTTPPAPSAPAVAAPPADETPREARASEAQLTQAEREALQVALKWAGFYNSGIDGAFGSGTRRAMEAWQIANGYTPTGVLSTLQRAALLAQYNAVLEGLDLQLVADANAGISIKMPMAAVGFEKYEYPFAHYSSTGDLPAKVLLISQKGDRTALFGLYDIMQTLAIVPPEGPRRRDSDGFFLIGQGTDFISHTEVTLQNGEIKGFTLLWPAGDEERRTRLLGEMQKSLQRSPGTLTPDMIGEQQRVDLVAGLKIRTPRLTRSGFFIDPQGHVVTALEAVQNCSSVTVENGLETNVTAVDAKLGIAILAPRTPIAPPAYAAFQANTPLLNADIAVSGYSYGGLLGAPTLTFGSLADLQGLAGETMLNRLQLASLPGDVGGPVIDASGAVLGMLLPGAAANNGRTLPDDVQFSLAGPVLRDTLTQLGLSPRNTSAQPNLPAKQLTDKAAQMTVLVNCWE